MRICLVLLGDVVFTPVSVLRFPFRSVSRPTCETMKVVIPVALPLAEMRSASPVSEADPSIPIDDLLLV